MKSWKTSNGYTVTRITGVAFACFLVQKDNQAILADTSRKIFRRKLLSQIEKRGTNSLKYVILTHAHFDHCENAAFLKDQTGALVIAHHGTTDLLSSGKNEAIRGSVWFTKPVTALFSNQINTILNYPPVPPDIPVPDEGLDFNSQGMNIRVICTPGHTSGSVSVIIDDEIALIGDLMTGMFPGLIFPHFADDPRGIFDSWNKLLKTNCSLFLPAHGFAITRKKVEKATENKRWNH